MNGRISLKARHGALSLTGLVCGIALAHTPICDCYDNGDGTVTCEGGFSDGTSASGVHMRILDELERLLLEGEMDEASTFTVEKPEGEYFVVFDPGEEHRVTIYGADIF